MKGSNTSREQESGTYGPTDQGFPAFSGAAGSAGVAT